MFRPLLFFGGIFQTLIYDNLTPAVQKVLRGRQHLEQEAFTKFHAYYNFTPCFCNPASGHEKGGVEGLMGYVKRNYLVPVPTGESLAEINEKILAQCLSFGGHRIQGRDGTVGELFEAEKDHLLELPLVPFSNLHTRDGKVDSYATVIVDKNRYSVPTQYVGLKVTVNLYVEHLGVFYDGKKIAVHQAKFPLLKTLENFDGEAAPCLDRRLVRGLESGAYLSEHRNVIFLGKSGTGKTHLATGLGVAACRQGVTTRFVTGPAPPWFGDHIYDILIGHLS